MAVQSSDSQETPSSSSSSQQKEVLIHKMVDDSTSSLYSSSSEEEKGVESKSGSDPRSSSVMTIMNKQKEEEVSNNTTNNKKVDSSSSSSSSSSEDESEEEKGVESKSGSDPQSSVVAIKNKQKEEVNNNNKKVDLSSSSSAEDDSEEKGVVEEEEDDEEAQEIRMKKKNDVMVIVAASTEDDEKVSEPEEDPNAVVAFNPDIGEIAKTQSSKRPLGEEKEEDISSADQGRKKMKAGVTGDLPRSKFEHKFTYDDELVIMKGYVDFNSKHKRLPRHKEFTDLIKPSISFPVTHRQISEKIRRLRNKYTNAIKGGKKKNTPHDLEVFELCENIWGDQNQSTNNKERGIIKQEAEVEENSKIFTFVNDYLGKIMAIGGGGICHIDLGVFDEGKRAYFAKKLKALMVKELELYSEKAELVTAIVEELKSKHRKAAI